MGNLGWKSSGLLLLIAYFVVKSYLHQRRIKQKYLNYGIKSVKTVPILGYIPFMLMSGGMNGAIVRTLKEHKELGPVFISWYFDRPLLEVAEPELLRDILSNKFVNYDRSDLEQLMFEELLGGGLILKSNGEGWKSHRQMLTHGFHQSKMISSIDDVGKRTMNFLKRLPLGRTIDIQDEFQQLTFDIMCFFSLGVSLETIQQDRGLSVAQLWYDILDHTQARFIALFPYWKFYETEGVKKYNFGMKTLKEIINQAIDVEMAKKAATEGEGSEGKSLISSMVQQHRENPEAFDRNDIIQHSLTFLFAGHDTTTNLLTFMVYNIGRDPMVLRHCLDEVDAVFEGKPADYLPNFTDIKSLRYLKMALKETLRLYPGAPLRGRMALQEDNLGKQKISIEKGMGIALDFLTPHLNPEYFPDPEKFDPERFSEEQEKQRPLHYFLPFGFGSRRCVGEQMAVNSALTVMSLLLRHRTIEVLPDNNIVREMTLTMRSQNGMKVVLKTRE